MSETAEDSAEEAGDAGTDPAETSPEMPELVDKEALVVIRARNAAVAVWLWRKFSTGTKRAKNQIGIGPWCGAIGEGAP